MVSTKLRTSAQLICPGDLAKTVEACADHFLRTAEAAIRHKGHFCVALSGGATPAQVYAKIYAKVVEKKTTLDWSKVSLFWSDERAVAITSQESNYRSAMEAGFGFLPIPQTHIHRMVAEQDIQAHAEAYEALLQSVSLDLMLLGMGDDGHTASLFPGTEALEEKKRWVVANYVPQKASWRMTVTFPCIQAATMTAVYVFGEAKKTMLAQALQEGPLPIQKIGSVLHPAYFFVDEAACAF